MSPGSLAALSELQLGDVILSLNGQPVNSIAELKTVSASIQSDVDVLVQLLRNGTKLILDLGVDNSAEDSHNNAGGGGGGLNTLNPSESPQHRNTHFPVSAYSPHTLKGLATCRLYNYEGLGDGLEGVFDESGLVEVQKLVELICDTPITIPLNNRGTLMIYPQ